MPAYILNRDGDLYYIESSSSIGVGKVIRILKPFEDRLIKDTVRADMDDYDEWKVTNTNTVVQERPGGGFEDATILTLERINVPVPFDRTIALGG